MLSATYLNRLSYLASLYTSNIYAQGIANGYLGGFKIESECIVCGRDIARGQSHRVCGIIYLYSISILIGLLISVMGLGGAGKSTVRTLAQLHHCRTSNPPIFSS